MKDSTIKVFCKNCQDGNKLVTFQEIEQRDGIPITVKKEARQRVSYTVTEKQLQGRTMSEFIESAPCRKCRAKMLVEVVG